MGSEVEPTKADRDKAYDLERTGDRNTIAYALAEERAKAQMPEPRTAQATQKPCELYAHTDSPHPSRTQYHHRHPVYLQNRVYGEIRDAAGDKMIWLCGLCHDSVHDVIGWLLGETRKPDPMPGRNAIAEAKRTVAWYQTATNGGTA